MKATTSLEKLFASLINAGVAMLLSLPFYLKFDAGLYWKITAILIFFVHELSFIVTSNKRDLGMKIVGSYWQNKPSPTR